MIQKRQNFAFFSSPLIALVCHPVLFNETNAISDAAKMRSLMSIPQSTTIAKSKCLITGSVVIECFSFFSLLKVDCYLLYLMTRQKTSILSGYTLSIERTPPIKQTITEGFHRGTKNYLAANSACSKSLEPTSSSEDGSKWGWKKSTKPNLQIVILFWIANDNVLAIVRMSYLDISCMPTIRGLCLLHRQKVSSIFFVWMAWTGR